MNRFRTLQWQLTAAYTLVSIILIIIIFVGGGYGFFFYQTLSGFTGKAIQRDLQSALGGEEFTKEFDSTPSQIAENIFSQIMVNCELGVRGSDSFIITNMADPLQNEQCEDHKNLYVGLSTAPSFFNTYHALSSFIIWFPERDAIVVDRNGRREEQVTFTEQQLNMIDGGIRGASYYEVNGLDTLVSVPYSIVNAETGVEETRAIVFIEVGFEASPFLGWTDAPAFVLPAGVILGFAVAIGVIGSYWVTHRLSRRIELLGALSEEWATGNFTAVSKDSSPDEIGQLGQRLNLMVEQLQNLLEARAELTAVEERNRIARDLHDAAKQQIFATDMQLYTAENLLDTDIPQAKTHVQEARRLTKSIQSELATLIDQLRPAQLDGKGLFEAVRETAVQFQEGNQLDVDLRLAGEQELPLEIEQPLFRIFQESLSNIARHSQASQIIVHLTAEKDKIQLQIKDNGIGFDQLNIKQGIGLASMQERIKPLSGELIIKSNPTQGTTITAIIPITNYQHP